MQKMTDRMEKYYNTYKNPNPFFQDQEAKMSRNNHCENFEACLFIVPRWDLGKFSIPIDCLQGFNYFGSSQYFEFMDYKYRVTYNA